MKEREIHREAGGHRGRDSKRETEKVSQMILGKMSRIYAIYKHYFEYGFSPDVINV